MYLELKTTEICELDQFIRHCTPLLKEHQLSIRKQDEMYVAELCSTEEPELSTT